MAPWICEPCLDGKPARLPHLATDNPRALRGAPRFDGIPAAGPGKPGQPGAPADPDAPGSPAAPGFEFVAEGISGPGTITAGFFFGPSLVFEPALNPKAKPGVHLNPQYPGFGGVAPDNPPAPEEEGEPMPLQVATVELMPIEFLAEAPANPQALEVGEVVDPEEV